MCIGCYREYGSPKVITKVTSYVVHCIGRVYDENSVGGNCHIIVDDWNLEDEHFDMVSKYELTPAEAELVAVMKEMTEDERATALALYEGWIDY